MFWRLSTLIAILILYTFHVFAYSFELEIFNTLVCRLWHLDYTSLMLNVIVMQWPLMVWRTPHVVYFNQLSGAAETWNLVKTLFWLLSTFFVDFRCFWVIFHPKKWCLDQLLGAHCAWKLVEIHNIPIDSQVWQFQWSLNSWNDAVAFGSLNFAYSISYQVPAIISN